MKQHQDKHDYKYVPWWPSDDVFFDPEEGEEDTFISYVARGLHQPPGGEVPFPGTSWSYRREQRGLGPESEKSDQVIHEKVLDKLYCSDKLDASKIIVTVVNGTVHLSGKVLTPMAVKEAEEVAKSIPHVWSVQNHLSVEEEQKKPS